MHTFNPGTQKTEAGGSLVQRQPGVLSVTRTARAGTQRTPASKNNNKELQIFFLFNSCILSVYVLPPLHITESKSLRAAALKHDGNSRQPELRSGDAE